MEFNKEQTYIVTGASSGIGRAVALKLNILGASVVAIARREEQLKSLKNEAKYSDNMYLEIKDLSQDVEELPNYIKELKDKYGKFSGMAYCAGIGGVTTIQTIDMQTFKDVFNINYYAPMFMTKGIADKRNNIGQGCSLVYIASLAATNPTAGQIVYGGTKGALVSSIKSISRELASRKIRCNTISPTWVKTPMYTETVENYGTKVGFYPLGLLEPDNVADLAIFLLSNKSSCITGNDCVIDSGGG